MIRSLQNIPSFQIEEIEVSKILLGCDAFTSWLYQGSDSPFKGSGGNLDISKVLEVMKTSVSYGVKCIDLSPPLIEALVRLQDKTEEKIERLGALQECTCKNFTIDYIPLADYDEEIKASVRQKLPQGYLADLHNPTCQIRSSFNFSLHQIVQFTIDSIPDR